MVNECESDRGERRERGEGGGSHSFPLSLPPSITFFYLRTSRTSEMLFAIQFAFPRSCAWISITSPRSRPEIGCIAPLTFMSPFGLYCTVITELRLQRLGGR